MSDEKLTWFETSPIVKGLILGGSMGMIAGWFGMDLGRSLALGLICGLAAGLTKFLADRKRRKS